MKFKTILFVFLLLLLEPIAAKIPLKNIVKNSDYMSVKISPTGKYLASLVNNNEKNILVILDIKTLKPTFVYQFNDKLEHVGNYYWVNDERVVFEKYEQETNDTRGKSLGQLYAGNYDGSKQATIFGVNTKKSGSRLKDNRVAAAGQLINLLKNDPDNILVKAYSFGGETSPDTLYKVNVYNGKLKKITRTPQQGTSVATDGNGVPLFLSAVDTFGDDRQYVFEDSKWKDISGKLGFEKFEVLGSTANGEYVYFFTPDNDQDEIYKLNIKTLKKELVKRANGYDFTDMIFEPKTKELIGVETMPGYYETEIFDSSSKYAKFQKLLKSAFGQMRTRVTSFTKDYKKAIVFASSDTNSGDYYLVDVENKKADFLLSANADLDPSTLSDMKPITYKTRDNQTIHGYLTLPKQKKSEYPLVLVVHGGPYGPYDRWGFDRDAQAFSNEGYAVLQVNYRGSGGYGKAFESTAYQKQHTMIMNDLLDGVKWAQSLPEISDNKACVYGWSFGGYSAAMLAIKGSDYLKCSIAAAGVYDSEYQNTQADYSSSKKLKKEVAKVYGDDPKLWRIQSPINYANDVKLPIFLIHGGKDTRVPPEQAKDLKSRLEKAGKEVEWLYKREEPHGFYNADNVVEMYEKSIKFLDKHLK